jgi:bZIP-type transcription factor MBZ1
MQSLADPPSSTNASTTTSFEDIFNIDMLAAPSLSPAHHSQSSPSARSSHSPPESFSALPPTPPQSFLSDPMLEGTSFFNFAMLDEDFSKAAMGGADSFGSTSLSGAPYDFFSSLADMSSMSSESSPSAVSNSPSNIFAIDPQLVGSPSSMTQDADVDTDSPIQTSTSHSTPPELDIDNDSDEEADSVPELPSTLTIKVGGKGKAAGRKGTVASGGVTKKSSTPVPAVQKREHSEEPEDWRPSPEEYKKMSSKEKRQLRNKISARNFRIRRKG